MARQIPSQQKIKEFDLVAIIKYQSESSPFDRGDIANAQQAISTSIGLFIDQNILTYDDTDP